VTTYELTRPKPPPGPPRTTLGNIVFGQ
jgi:hypothetical protein